MQVQVVKLDYLDNRNILTELSTLEIYAETLACVGVKSSPVSVLSVTAFEILFIDYSKIITACTLACGFHTKLIENMLRLIANKNLLLKQKIELISKRTTPEKLLAYFAFQAK